MSAEILAIVQDTVSDVLDTEFVLDRNTTAAHVPGWDSMAHVQIVLALERRLGIRFATAEISELQNIGDLIDAISRLKS